ncbi:MAG: hypothetical protein HFJ52_07675 [Clostridia bacterium]|nr:hypothetical protein [Clostridia bacterium]
MQPEGLIEKMNCQEKTKEERIEKLEQEVLNLKEELKRTRKANVWKKVKNKFENDFNNFNWTYEWNSKNCYNEPISTKREMNESYHISQAIGTLVRIVLQKKGLNYLEESDMEKAEKITKEILEIMKSNKI